MRTLPICLSILVLAGLAAAQPVKIARIPTTPFSTDDFNNIPLAFQPMRYQQWYSASQWRAVARRPVRVNAVSFLAGQILQSGSTVDLEIRIAHLPNVQPGSTFNSNLVADNTLVVPRGIFTLTSMPVPGARVFTFNFNQEFIWDGASGVILDIKVFGNGNNNMPYLYHCRGAAGALGKITRLYAPGNPNTVTRATIRQQGIGLVTEFDYREGVTVSYGDACFGGGGLRPNAGTQGGLPIPPNLGWTQTLASAAATAPAVLLLGVDRTMFNGVPLPIELRVIGGFNCFLRVAPLVYLPASTTAAGFASVPTPIPGVTFRGAREIYTEWIILDMQAPNGVLSATQGLWHIIG